MNTGCIEEEKKGQQVCFNMGNLLIFKLSILKKQNLIYKVILRRKGYGYFLG